MGAICGDKAQERNDVDNLRRGIVLVAKYPHLLHVTCQQCRYWHYDPIDGDLATREGEPLRRIPGSVLMCETRDGCPRGHWSKPVELSEKNRLAWEHYKLCRATNHWPADAIVQRNAAIITKALESRGVPK